MSWLRITVLIFVLDQFSKTFFQAELSVYQQTMVAPDLLSWILAYNTDVAFSFLADSSDWQRWLSTLIVIVVSAILVVWLKHLERGETWLTIALVLVLDDTLGNLYGRMVLDHVVDFILVYQQSRWYFPAFNLADSAITIDAVMLALGMFRSKKSGEAAHG